MKNYLLLFCTIMQSDAIPPVHPTIEFCAESGAYVYLCHCGHFCLHKGAYLQHFSRPDKRCEKCPKWVNTWVNSCNEEWHLKEHHSEEMPYYCVECSSVFATLFGLKSHVQDQHGLTQ